MTDSGTSTEIGNWVHDWIAELDSDAVGLWQIVPTGRDQFGLDGDALRGFVRKAILALLDAGAEPVVGSDEPTGLFVKTEAYGSDKTSQVDNILAEWQASGKDPDLDGLWFWRFD